jgi:hypothetical protein
LHEECTDAWMSYSERRFSVPRRRRLGCHSVRPCSRASTSQSTRTWYGREASRAGAPLGTACPVFVMATRLQLSQFLIGIGRSTAVSSTAQLKKREVEAEVLTVGRRSTGAHVCGQPLGDAFHSADWNVLAIAKHAQSVIRRGHARPTALGEGDA